MQNLWLLPLPSGAQAYFWFSFSFPSVFTLVITISHSLFAQYVIPLQMGDFHGAWIS
jgi:hypothetical protein